MDYSKLDGPLAAALTQKDPAAQERLPVFLRTQTDLTQDAKNMLSASGIQAGAESATVFAGELSLDEVASLSDQPWVVSIRLGRKTRPHKE